jgi:MFS family permease
VKAILTNKGRLGQLLANRLPRYLDTKPDKTRRLFIIDGALINAAVVLTSGVFLSGYIVLLGGSDFLVGLLNNSLTWASIAAVFSSILFERMVKRKPLLMTLLILSRVLVCLTVFLPLFLGDSNAVLPLLTIMVVIGNVLFGIYSVGFVVWMMESFPRDSRSDFVFHRMFWLRISFTLATIVMGYVLDWSGKSYTGFLIVFLASLVLSLGDALTLLRIDESAHKTRQNRHVSMAEFTAPLTCRPFRNYLLFISLYYLSLTISSSFSSLYLIRYLEFDYTFISFINVIAYFFMIVCTRLWGRLESRIGKNRVIILTGLIAIIEFLIYGFLTHDTYYLLYLAPVFAGIGNSGFNVFTFNRRYELMPEENRTLYEGWFGAFFGLSVLIGPALGSLLMDRLPVIQNGVFEYSKFQLIYLISFVLAAGTLFFLVDKPTADREITSEANTEGNVGASKEAEHVH